MKVHELMTANPRCCTADTSLREVARMMLDCDCGEIPVVESHTSGKPIGVITDRDICVRGVAEGKSPDTRVSEVMTHSPLECRPDARLDDCLRLMEEQQLRRMLVVDDAGRLCGIVAQADIARHNQSEREVAEVVRKISEPSHIGA